MDLELNETQQMMQRSAREFLAKECPKSLIRQVEGEERGYSPELWGKMAAQGWMGVPFPESYGGSDGNLMDLAIYVEEMGRAVALSPYLPTMLCGLTLLAAGSDAQKRQFLPMTARGEMLMTLALTEPSAKYTPEGVSLQARATGDHFVLDGVKLFVEYAHVADYLIVAARTRQTSDPAQGITLLLVPGKSPGINYTLLKTIGGDKQCEVTFKGVQVPRANVLGKVDQGWPIAEKAVELATALLCSDAVGGAQQTLEMTVDYAKMRVQFGQPIGRFQAVQHHCANMAMLVDGARFTTYEAIWRLSEGRPARKEVAIAKAFTSDAYREVTLTAHQIHGGIGFMKEYDLQFYSRRAKAVELKLGTPSEHLATVASEMGL